jgi:hypothetical protein
LSPEANISRHLMAPSMSCALFMSRHLTVFTQTNKQALAYARTRTTSNE